MPEESLNDKLMNYQITRSKIIERIAECKATLRHNLYTCDNIISNAIHHASSMAYGIINSYEDGRKDEQEINKAKGGE